MKRLIDDKYESYNKLGSKIDSQFNELVSSFVREKAMDGISLLDLQYIMMSVVYRECIFQRSFRACNIIAKERREDAA